MNQITDTASFALQAGEAGFDPIEERLRFSVRATIEAVFEEELAGFLGRLRYSRGDGPAKGYRHGHRGRQLTGIPPRSRLEAETETPGCRPGTHRCRKGLRRRLPP